MDAREKRGLQLAQRGKIMKLTQGWRVPSQSGVSSTLFVSPKSLRVPVRTLKTGKCTANISMRWNILSRWKD